MIPDHCKNVSKHKVNFELTPEKINRQLLDSKIYKGTEFLILNNRNAWSVVRVEKTPRRGLFWKVTGVEIISKPEDTIYLEDTTIDVLNKNMMVQVADENPDKVVVVKGAFEHVSFVTPGPAIDLLILEVIPPEPPKLNSLVKNLLKIKSYSKPIRFTEKTVDITSFIENEKSEIIILPCNASGLKTDKNILHLDEKPELDPVDKNSMTLIGCDLSLRIFKELYNFEPRFINICPAKLANEFIKTSPVLVKCCQVKDYERRDNLFMVPWGATYENIELTLSKIVGLTEKKDK